MRATRFSRKNADANVVWVGSPTITDPKAGSKNDPVDGDLAVANHGASGADRPGNERKPDARTRRARAAGRRKR